MNGYELLALASMRTDGEVLIGGAGTDVRIGGEGELKLVGGFGTERS